MAFNRENLGRIGGGGNNAPSVFGYYTTDNKATTLASGYFNTGTYVFNKGDFILALCSDGAMVMSISSATDAATVTTITAALA